MNKEYKEKWIAALRSGKYKQGTGSLRKNDKFCCLGVLCDIVDSSKWELPRSEGTPIVYDSRTSYLPEKIKNNLNIEYRQQKDLAELNDEGKSFNEIADWIEENL